ncbi:hypothetical protein BRAO285_790004 [Bradyrhizobium sp. ORS 285]|nr:hypothetical protein BRAO285_790004 [Bradyrhizobium sp. ORS 285]
MIASGSLIASTSSSTSPLSLTTKIAADPCRRPVRRRTPWRASRVGESSNSAWPPLCVSSWTVRPITDSTETSPCERRKRPDLARLSGSTLSLHFAVSATVENLPVGPKRFENKARPEWWSLHIEAWRRSGLGIRKYCQQHRLTENPLRRWLKRLAGNETALKLEKFQTELRRERTREEREKALRKQKQRRFTVASDVLRNPCRGAEPERNGAPRLCRGAAAVAAFATQMALPIGHWGGHDRLARPSSTLRPSGR